jgi:hypothetical protein
MLDFFRDRLTAHEVLDYLEHLPRTSAYHSAVADDEDLAEQLAEQGTGSAPRPPRLAEFSPEVQVMAEVRDLLATLIGVQVARAGKKPQKIKPYPRPENALDRVRRRRRYADHRILVGRVLPRRN